MKKQEGKNCKWYMDVVGGGKCVKSIGYRNHYCTGEENNCGWFEKRSTKDWFKVLGFRIKLSEVSVISEVQIYSMAKKEAGVDLGKWAFSVMVGVQSIDVVLDTEKQAKKLHDELCKAVGAK